MKIPALYTAAVIFAAVALAHLARLIDGMEITIDGAVVPMGLSALALIVAGGLALWMILAARRA